MDIERIDKYQKYAAVLCVATAVVEFTELFIPSGMEIRSFFSVVFQCIMIAALVMSGLWIGKGKIGRKLKKWICRWMIVSVIIAPFDLLVGIQLLPFGIMLLNGIMIFIDTIVLAAAMFPLYRCISIVSDRDLSEKVYKVKKLYMYTGVVHLGIWIGFSMIQILNCFFAGSFEGLGISTIYRILEGAAFLCMGLWVKARADKIEMKSRRRPCEKMNQGGWDRPDFQENDRDRNDCCFYDHGSYDPDDYDNDRFDDNDRYDDDDRYGDDDGYDDDDDDDDDGYDDDDDGYDDDDDDGYDDDDDGYDDDDGDWDSDDDGGWDSDDDGGWDGDDD